ncbi:hypothetical protein F442_10777 [Phytophthora nicotianae P10297]|uniref:RxLR effector protein n=2 Tax=Phytophthora nicotianae TaxID=4792 RepID=W2Z5S1_PHYNI|nr:hypothetical protein F444_10933 [Phytophthora nicotianae P1976]ETP42301.1 hypothetical protein F442_10777 [Phytophthora nicotianae P10297]
MSCRFARVLLVVVVVTYFDGLTSADFDGSVQIRNSQDTFNRNLKENAPQHLKGPEDVDDHSTNEERGILSAIKSKILFNKPPKVDKTKQLSGTKPDANKIQIAAGQKVDLSKLKTTSGKTFDLSKAEFKVISAKEADVSKLKKLAEKDPDVLSISVAGGKSPKQFSTKQVSDLQSLIKKHPESRGFLSPNLIGVAAVVLLFVGPSIALIVVGATTDTSPK